MHLERTLILPADSKRLSMQLLRHYVNEEAYALLVVLGTGDEAEVFVQRADQLARRSDWRWVIWARKPEHIADFPYQGELKPGFDPPDRGFALSLSDEVRDLIGASEEVPDLVRVLAAFARAESSE